MDKTMLFSFVVVAALIVLDIITGVLKAVETRTMNSSKLRTGLYHKGAFIGVIVLAVIVEWGSGFLQLGFRLPIVTPVCVYVALTEIVSAFENLCEINPELRGSKIAVIFGGNINEKGNGNGIANS